MKMRDEWLTIVPEGQQDEVVSKITEMVNEKLKLNNKSKTVPMLYYEGNEKMTETDKCTCNEVEHEPHPCPYTQDVCNEYELPEDEWELCTCCPECTHQCAMDI